MFDSFLEQVYEHRAAHYQAIEEALKPYFEQCGSMQEWSQRMVSFERRPWDGVVVFQFDNVPVLESRQWVDGHSIGWTIKKL